jgi:hypothetical protein
MARRATTAVAHHPVMPALLGWLGGPSRPNPSGSLRGVICGRAWNRPGSLRECVIQGGYPRSRVRAHGTLRAVARPEPRPSGQWENGTWRCVAPNAGAWLMPGGLWNAARTQSAAVGTSPISVTRTGDTGRTVTGSGSASRHFARSSGPRSRQTLLGVPGSRILDPEPRGVCSRNRLQTCFLGQLGGITSGSLDAL